VGKHNGEVGVVSNAMWETSDVWVWVKVQEFLQAVLEEEVTAPLGRRKSEREGKESARRYGRWYPEAAELQVSDWERMVTFYGFLEARWTHLRTTASKRFEKVPSATALTWRVLMVAEKRFRRLDFPELLAVVAARESYTDGQLRTRAH